jgi:hypothetical protein
MCRCGILPQPTKYDKTMLKQQSFLRRRSVAGTYLCATKINWIPFSVCQGSAMAKPAAGP